MHVVIINASPRIAKCSNTAKILHPFVEGVEEEGGSVELFSLSERCQWKTAMNAFYMNENIIFALPVFTETIPGIMMEFLEELSVEMQKRENRLSTRRLSFILQSGFPEACQRRNCENYLELLPSELNSEFAGILSYGFNMRFIQNKEFEEVLCSYKKMGKGYIAHNCTFFFQEAKAFTGQDFFSTEEANLFNRIFNRLWRYISKERGCGASLCDKPYEREE